LVDQIGLNVFTLLLEPVFLFYINVQILKYLEENSSLALDTRRKERERKRNRRMTMVLSCIALTFAVIFSPPLPHSFFCGCN
jgi:hypothetical protein